MACAELKQSIILETVKNSTAQLKSGLSKLRKGVEESKIALKNGEKIYCWEYVALQEIATNSGLTMEEIESKIKIQNGGVVSLDLSYSETTDLSPIASLSSLQRLELSGTQVEELSPLSGLSSLQKLWLNGTPALVSSKEIIISLKGRGVTVIR